MKRLILFCSLFLALVLAACGGTSSPEEASSSQEIMEEGDGPIVTVYRAPT